jgi:hypothetical protein
MNELTLRAIHEEALSLVQRGVEEFEEGETCVGVSLLLEAQFLLGEVIQQQLNQIDSTPPLSPSSDESINDRDPAIIAAAIT